MLLGPVIGAIIGAVILPPIVFYIGESGAFERQYFLENAIKPMSLYFFAAGVILGLAAGYFRRKLVLKNAELKAHKEQLQELLLEKETLLRILSHDLANHACVSKGFLGLALNEAGESLGKEARSRLDVVGETLAKSIDLIEFTRKYLAIDSGKIEMDLERLPLAPILEDCLKTFSEQSRAKNVELAFSMHSHQAMASLDPVAFSSCVMNNLVSNALKFSEVGGVVSVDVTSRAGGVDIAVSNFGPGIPQDKMPSLFSMTERTTSVGTAGEKGTGFGLPLASKFVSLMGGELRVESEPFSAKSELSMTVFTVSLPAQGVVRRPEEIRELWSARNAYFDEAGAMAA